MKTLAVKAKEIIVDDDVFEWMVNHSWHINPRSGYVTHGCCRGKEQLYLARHIMNPPAGMVVDHINRDKLDNRRENLRIVSHRQNLSNRVLKPGTSAYKGVQFDKTRNKWRMSIRTASGKRIFARYDTEIEAALAYNRLALIEYGEVALLNIVE